MRQQYLTLEAAAASLIAALPLSALFEQWTWLRDGLLAVVALTAVAALVRWLRAPDWVPMLAMAAALPVVLTRLFPSGAEVFSVVPTPDTLLYFGHLLTTAVVDLRQYSAPAPDRTSFLFVATLGIAGTAILIDTCVVALRRPAIAGLPMLAMYSVPVAIRTESISIVPFVLGAACFLWLLSSESIDRVRRFGRRFSGSGRSVESWESSPLAAAGRRLGAAGLVLAALVPVALPGMTTGLFDQFATGVGSGAGSGRSAASVSLSAMLAGNLNRNKPLDMLRVETNDSNPYYLRFGVADQLTESGFRHRKATGGRSITDLPIPGAPLAGVTRYTQRASVDVLNLESPFLPVYQQPTKVDHLGKSWMYDLNTSVIYSGSESTRKKKYAFDYVRSEYSPAALRSAARTTQKNSGSPDLVYVPKVQEVQTLVSRLVSGKQTQYDEVMAIFDYFSPQQGFSYQLHTEPGTNAQEIVNFLNNKRGFCVQYSASMAWMVRQAGYPARVAFGFSRGSSQRGSTMTLTNLNLHAWTEVYFAGLGWVPFDPTPAAGVPGSVSPTWAPNPSLPDESAQNTPDTSANVPSTPRASSGAASGTPDAAQSQNATAVPSGGGKHLPQWPIWTVLCTIVALGVLAVPGLLRRASRRGRLRFHAATLGQGAGTASPSRPEPSEPSDAARSDALSDTARRDAHAAWDELLDTMTDYGIPLSESETPRATANRLAAAPMPPAAATGVRILGNAEERARYAPRPMPVDTLKPSLDTVRAALVARANRWTRIRAILLPPSVFRRWRSRIARPS